MQTSHAPKADGLLQNIDHIIVVMLENRSFDHMLGFCTSVSDQAWHFDSWLAA